ncbi:hypothetical protein OSB04_012657 [Centaurea solstitialis]|uniref:Chromo domain-containing protein n=1 Tax=Centaurea solstitialis TaxID=347529 RepID=A0AA38TBT4_9ASTR|nr:hypothetical protein OSB04_012657 [Centaurea solstitialis]
MRQRKWLELLKDYDCELLYHPGKANVGSDALSRKEYSGVIRPTVSRIEVISSLTEKIKTVQVETLHEENLKEEAMKSITPPHTGVEVGARHNGLCDEVIEDASRTRYYLGGGRPIDQECTLLERTGYKSQLEYKRLEAGEKQFAGPEIVQETTDKVKIIRERLRVTHDRQKSYADKKRRPIEFQVGDKVMLKVSSWKGLIRFGKQGKLSPRFLGPFTILERIKLHAYKLELPPEMDGIHPTLHVCYLRRCLAEEESTIPLLEVRVDNSRCIEEPETILEKKVKRLRNIEVTMLKVQWKHHRGAKVTWESEEDMKRRYPNMF